MVMVMVMMIMMMIMMMDDDDDHDNHDDHDHDHGVKVMLMIIWISLFAIYVYSRGGLYGDHVPPHCIGGIRPLRHRPGSGMLQTNNSTAAQSLPLLGASLPA